MKRLLINPPLLNTPCPWCSELDNLRELYACEHTGAITTRTSMLTPYPHDWEINQYVLFDSTKHQVASVNTQDATSQQTASLNTIGLSPNNLETSLGFVQIISDEQEADQLTKPIIISVAGTPEDVAEAYRSISAKQDQVKMPLAMEINLSCPNLPGEVSPAYHSEDLVPYLSALQAEILDQKATGVDRGLPIGIKTPPFTYQDQYDELVSALLEATTNPDFPSLPLAFVTTTNTLGSSLVMTGDQPTLHSSNGSGIGGLAGTAIHALSLGNVYTLRQLFNNHDQLKDIQLIGVGGVNDCASFERMKAVGADFVGVATALGVKGIKVFAEILS